MWTVINGFDMTQNIVGYDGQSLIKITQNANDPLPKADFIVDDPTSSIALATQQEVIVFDENAASPYGGTMIPAHNIARNPNFINHGYWPSNGNLASACLTISGNAVNIVFNNATYSGSPSTSYAQVQQNTIIDLVHPGQQYMFSVYVTCTGTVTNANAIIRLDWLDMFGNVITQNGGPNTYFVPQIGTNRVNVYGTAPSGAYGAQLDLGAQVTSATNALNLTYTQAQFEPMWFVAEGVSYPTSFMSYMQSDSIQMPDGSASRACRIFAGYVNDTQAEYRGNFRTWTVSCSGSQAILDETGLYNNDLQYQYDDQIIAAVMNTGMYTNLLATGQPNAFLPNTIVRGVEIDEASFADQTFREVLNYLIDNSNYTYFVDPYYYLHYCPQLYAQAQFSLSDNPDNLTTFAPLDYKVEVDGTQIKNRVKVTGADYLNPPRTDYFSGNGSNRVFAPTYQPHTSFSLTVGGASKVLGLATLIPGFTSGGTVPSGYDAVYDKAMQELTFATAPASGTNNIAWQYDYQAPVAVIVEDIGSITAVGRAFDTKVNDSSLNTATQCKSRGLAELAKWVNPKVSITCSLAWPLYNGAMFQLPSVGSTIYLTSTHDSYSNMPFTIQQMDIEHRGGGTSILTLTLGSYLLNFVDHARNTHKAVNRSRYPSGAAISQSTDLVMQDIFYMLDILATIIAAGTTDITTYSEVINFGAISALSDTTTYSDSFKTPTTTTTSVYGTAVYGQNGYF